MLVSPVPWKRVSRTMIHVSISDEKLTYDQGMCRQVLYKYEQVPSVTRTRQGLEKPDGLNKVWDGCNLLKHEGYIEKK